MPSRADLVRQCFAAYKNHDRKALEDSFADDFTFTSPWDDAIDKAAYFERCWPVSESIIKENVLERIFEQGDDAFVTYRCLTHDGDTFRNTEFFVFEGDKVKSINVYFGASYRDGEFVKAKQ